MRFNQRVLTGLLAGTLLAGSAGSVFAAHSQTRVSGLVVVSGKVSGVTAGSFVVTPAVATAAGTTAASTTVTVSATTKETPRKGTTGALTNGEYVVVVGIRTANGVTARHVLYSTTAINARPIVKRVRAARAARAARKRHVAIGTVNLSGTTTTSLNITTKAGKTLTFALTSTTKFRVNKVVSLTLPTFTTGERVAVVYKRDATTKTRVALGVAVLAPKA